MTVWVFGDQKQKMAKRPVFIATHQLFSTRYLLGSAILDSLKRAEVPVVVISPNAENKAFREMFEDELVTVEKYRYDELATHSRSRLYNFFVRVRWLTLPAEHDITTVRLHEAQELHKKPQMSFLHQRLLELEIGLARLLRKSRVLRHLFVRLERTLFRSAAHADLFKKYDPALLIINDIGTIDLSNFLIAEAQQHGVEVVSVVLSWDNLTSKGIGGSTPEFAIAWNDNMKQELIRYHGMEPERIHVAGIAHFDDYFRQPRTWADRATFLQSYQLSDLRKTLFYGMSSPRLFRHNVQFIRLLLQACADGKFCQPCQLLIRFHPAFYVKKKGELATILQQIIALKAEFGDLLALSQPLTVDQEFGAVQPIEDQKNLAAILEHSDVMINIFSTLMLEACIFDLPVINLGFYQFANMNLENQILKNLTHIKRIVDYGAVRIAYSEEELYEQINMYLVDRSLDHSARMKVRTQEAGPNKGQAGAAIAQHIVALAGFKNKNDEAAPGSAKVVDDAITIPDATVAA